MVDLAFEDGSKLTATDGHPFWDVSTGLFTEAVDLMVGELVLTLEGQSLKIISVRVHGEDLTAYNLEIEGIHTYYAGETPVLVHNDCDDPIELIYEASPKHGPVARPGPRGEISRAPQGDCQTMLECSVLIKPRQRVGVEPGTGLPVIFRRTREFDGQEWWHGFVPGG